MPTDDGAPRTGDGGGVAADGAGPHLGRGINFGNALDTPRGDPSFQLREQYFDDVRAAGFTTVRLPVRWSAHAGESPPYAISPEFFGRVDWAVRQALRRDLNVVLNVHHYHELIAAPQRHRVRYLALWAQIAAHYAGWSARLHFELLNEPRGAMTPEAWNDLLPMALATVRDCHPDRIVIVGPAQMNDIAALPQLALPADDRLVVTIHYYAPFEFTHQGASWVAGAGPWLGTRWSDDTGRQAVHDDLAAAAAWANEHGRPLFIGEFGTYARADMNSRQEWTRRVRLEAEFLGLSWCYWDFGTDFGAFDTHRGAWREPLMDALLTAPARRRTG
jgi:endoglucanase